MLVSMYATQPPPAPGQPRALPRYVEAEAILTPVLEDQRRKMGITHNATRSSTILLANLYFQQGKIAEAEALLTPVVTDDYMAKVLQGGSKEIRANQLILDGLDILSQIQLRKGNVAEADVLDAKLQQVLDAAIKSTPVSSAPSEPNPLSDPLVTPLLATFSRGMQYLNTNRDARADAMFNTILEGYRRIVGNGPSVLIIADRLSVAANQYTAKGNLVQAERFLQSLLDIHRGVLGDSSLTTHTSASRLAQWYSQRRRYKEGAELLMQLQEMQTKALGPNHPNLQSSNRTLNTMYMDEAKDLLLQGKTGEARQVWLKSAEVLVDMEARARSAVGGDRTAEYRIIVASLGNSYGAGGKYAESERFFKEVVDAERAAPSSLQGSLPWFVADIGWAQFHQGKLAEAEATLRTAMPGAGRSTWDDYNIESMLGVALTAQKKFEEAEQHLLRSYEQMGRLTPGVYRGFHAEVVPGERVLALYEAWGKPEKVAEWKAKVDTARQAALAAR
jgi:tetratricopeptide (TPR) repeat protein